MNVGDKVKIHDFFAPDKLLHKIGKIITLEEQELKRADNTTEIVTWVTVDFDGTIYIRLKKCYVKVD